MRLVASGVLVVFAISAGACGSDDENGGGAATAAKGGDTEQAAAATGAEAEIRKLHADITKSVYSTDYRVACASMTPAHRRKSVGKGNCVDALRDFWNNRKPPGPKPDVLRVNVRGDEATAITRTPGRSPYKLIFVRRGGDWKLDAAIGGGAGRDGR